MLALAGTLLACVVAACDIKSEKKDGAGGGGGEGSGGGGTASKDASQSKGSPAGGLLRSRSAARELKTSTQLRLIGQALFMHANNWKDRFPVPSARDANGATINIPGDTRRPGGPATVKDNTGNMLSILIFDNMISPDMVIHPGEQSSSVAIDTKYEHSAPTRAARPKDAVWDPGFAGTPIDSGPGAPRRKPGTSNNSFATTIFANVPGNDKARSWQADYSASSVLVSSRGPAYVETSTPASGTWTLAPRGSTPPGVESVTLAIGGLPDAWTGMAAYGDGSARRLDRPEAEDVVMSSNGPGGSVRNVPDNIFVNETNDATIRPAAAAPRAGEEPVSPHVRGRNLFLMPFCTMPGGEIQLWRD